MMSISARGTLHRQRFAPFQALSFVHVTDPPSKRELQVPRLRCVVFSSHVRTPSRQPSKLVYVFSCFWRFYGYNAGHKCWDNCHNFSWNWHLAPLPPSNVENWPSHATKSFFNIATGGRGGGGLRDNQEVLDTVFEQGKQYKKTFYTSKVIT